MVEVIVEDKLKPTISCPPNITLSCTDNYDLNHLDIFGSVVTKLSDVKDVNVYNYYHNGLVGKDGLAKDNCSVTVSNSYVTDIHCFTGTIMRKFIATDSAGLKDSCIQTITILNPNPFPTLTSHGQLLMNPMDAGLTRPILPLLVNLPF